MKIQKIALSRIEPATYNARKNLRPEDPEYKKLLRSIDAFGFVEPLIWNRKTGHLVGGHQRLKILLAKGIKEAHVSIVDLPLEKEKALNVALNAISGEWDKDKLNSLLGELCRVPDFDVELTGLDLPDIENMLGNTLEEAQRDENFDVESELAAGNKAVTKPGELILLGPDGEHRLQCGDVTKTSDVSSLMVQFRAQLCHTDPPYGVSYDRRNRPSSKRKKSKTNPEDSKSMKLRNDDLTTKRYRQWFYKVIGAINETLVSGAAYYIWNSHKNFGLMHELLSEKGFKVSSVITWAKESFAPGFGDYNEQTEFCLYGFKGGSRHSWFGPKNESTLWRINRDRTQLYYHPTQKALMLAERAIRNSSKHGDIVFDPFLGSGTTLIAAARLGRRCFGMEIEPRYCDCIVRRYIALAGESAVSQEIARRYRIEGSADGPSK